MQRVVLWLACQFTYSNPRIGIRRMRSSHVTTTDTTSASTRHTRRSTSTAGSSTRARRPRLGGDALLGELTAMVDKLISENRELKRALAKVEKSPVGAGLGEATRALAGLQRRVSRALDGDGGSGRRGGAAVGVVRTRRKVTDPEVLEKRRAALAKARAARAAKRAEALE